MVDVLVEESLKFEKAEENKMLKKFDNINIPVIAIDKLIKMKKKSGRAKDLKDVDILKQLESL